VPVVPVASTAMCGVIAVLRRRPSRPLPDGVALLAALDAAAEALRAGATGVAAAASAVADADRALRGVPGLTLLICEPGFAGDVATRVGRLESTLAGIEEELDAGTADLGKLALEAVNAALVACKDALWALGHDRLRTAAAVAELAGPSPTPSQLEAYVSVQLALSGLDRLEVRGRDSAGLHVLVTGHSLDLDHPSVVEVLAPRLADRLFTSGAVRVVGDSLSFVYKAAAEIGELGDNGAALRAAVQGDALLRRALAGEGATATVLGHTRWASVGIISQANAHPLNSEEISGPERPYVTAALNGDVDNYVALREEAGLLIPAEVTTDAKIIPALVAHRLAAGERVDDAFVHTVAAFDGSVAIAVSSAATPDRLHLALRGSGQALYVGLAEDAFVVASEPYGLVEATPRYLRMDGEATGGQVVVLDRSGAGTLEGLRRIAYDGTPLPVDADEVVTAEITTRDIDRAGFPHFLIKEITEAPESFRKTLRGRVIERDGLLAVELGDGALTPAARERLATGAIRRVFVIGQGTAAVAAQSVAASLRDCLGDNGMTVSAVLATELSGFDLDDDMSDALVIAVSQSGTTTDTNRTVDLVRGRGATVLAIVNRRNSDLVEKADGVIYNSDGRDVEMAVPSTKAFYAQIAAGFLLAIAVADALGCGDPQRDHELLSALRALPEAMAEVLARRPAIASAAALAPPRRYWAIVGNGRNRVAAEEVRIKLSELCYKSIACDATEDKKHIDLSSEPLILVCAAGLEGPNATDVAKEIAIYRAHKATPVVIASDGADGFAGAAAAVIRVPPVHPAVAFVLSAMAGHLFGYEAACAIDAQALPLREGRAAIEAVIAEESMATATPTGGVGPADGLADRPTLLERLAPRLAAATRPFLAGLGAGEYDGNLEASTAVRLTTMLRYATGQLQLEDYELESGKLGTPTALVDDVVLALTRGIDELTRPIDAIKHQAKTVTVGISRSEDALLGVPLVAKLLAVGARRDHLAYRTLRTLAALDPAVEEVTGYTRYRIEGAPASAGTIRVVDRGGSAAGLRSRTESDPTLRGTKRRTAEEREVIVTVGRNDGRTVVIVPELKANHIVGLDLLHVRVADRLEAAVAREVLSGYGGKRSRYSALVDAVTETVPVFDDAVLGQVSVTDLLTEPVNVLADRWKA